MQTILKKVTPWQTDNSLQRWVQMKTKSSLIAIILFNSSVGFAKKYWLYRLGLKILTFVQHHMFPRSLSPYKRYFKWKTKNKSENPYSKWVGLQEFKENTKDLMWKIQYKYLLIILYLY